MSVMSGEKKGEQSMYYVCFSFVAVLSNNLTYRCAHFSFDPFQRHTSIPVFSRA